MMLMEFQTTAYVFAVMNARHDGTTDIFYSCCESFFYSSFQVFKNISISTSSESQTSAYVFVAMLAWHDGTTAAFTLSSFSNHTP